MGQPYCSQAAVEVHIRARPVMSWCGVIDLIARASGDISLSGANLHAFLSISLPVQCKGISAIRRKLKMATQRSGEKTTGVNTNSENEGTDIAELWNEALKSYYVTTGQDLRTLPKFRNVNDIMNDAQLKNDLFDNFRHDKGKVDKLRSAVTRNSDLVMKGAEYIAQAAIPVGSTV